jgi:hypothetical protein
MPGFQSGSGSAPRHLWHPLISTDILLDDIVLTHSLFLPTEKFLQELHQSYPFVEFVTWQAR